MIRGKREDVKEGKQGEKEKVHDKMINEEWGELRRIRKMIGKEEQNEV